MSCGEIHKNDVGTPFEITLLHNGAVVNLSGVSSLSLEFLKPNEDSLTVTPSFITNGTDGQLRYVFGSGDLDIVGMWEYQVSYIRSGNMRASAVKTFRVYENI